MIFEVDSCTEVYIVSCQANRVSNNSLSLITSYFLTIPVITALPPPSADFCLSGRTPPTIPIAPPALLLFAFQIVYILWRRVIYTGRIGVGS